MQIEGSVVCLIAVAIIGIAMYVTGANSPIGFTVRELPSTDPAT